MVCYQIQFEKTKSPHHHIHASALVQRSARSRSAQFNSGRRAFLSFFFVITGECHCFVCEEGDSPTPIDNQVKKFTPVQFLDETTRLRTSVQGRTAFHLCLQSQSNFSLHVVSRHEIQPLQSAAAATNEMLLSSGTVT